MGTFKEHGETRRETEYLPRTYFTGSKTPSSRSLTNTHRGSNSIRELSLKPLLYLVARQDRPARQYHMLRKGTFLNYMLIFILCGNDCSYMC